MHSAILASRRASSSSGDNARNSQASAKVRLEVAFGLGMSKLFRTIYGCVLFSGNSSLIYPACQGCTHTTPLVPYIPRHERRGSTAHPDTSWIVHRMSPILQP